MVNQVHAYNLAAELQKKEDMNTKEVCKAFAAKHNFNIDAFYTEPTTIKALATSALRRLLNNCNNHDVLLIKDTSVFAALNSESWQQLAGEVRDKQLRVVIIDVPMTWQQLKSGPADANQEQDDNTVKFLLIDVLAGIAIAAQDKKRRAQAEGIKHAQAQGKYEGRKPNVDQYKAILKCLSDDMTYKEIEAALGCSSRTIAKAKKWQAAGV